MGGSTSRFIQTPQATAFAPTPLSTGQVCAVKKQQLLQTERDLLNRRKDVDTCDPIQTQKEKTRKAIQENTEWAKRANADFRSKSEVFLQTQATLRNLAASAKPLEEYLKELQTKKTRLDKENEALDRSIRAGRRRFLDGSPQEGVSSVLGQKTNDDKILLAFWSSILVFVTLSVFVYIRAFNKEQRVLPYASTLIVVYILAYVCIYKYA